MSSAGLNVIEEEKKVIPAPRLIKKKRKEELGKLSFSFVSSLAGGQHNIRPMNYIRLPEETKNKERFPGPVSFHDMTGLTVNNMARSS